MSTLNLHRVRTQRGHASLIRCFKLNRILGIEAGFCVTKGKKKKMQDKLYLLSTKYLDMHVDLLVLGG